MIVERLNQIAAPDWIARAKDHLRVSDDAQAPLIQTMIAATVTELEQYGQLALLTQSIRVSLDRWPCADWLALPIAPVINAGSVVITADGVPFTSFVVMTGLRPAVRLTDARPDGVIVIGYSAGFGVNAAAIPADLSHAILDQVLVLFDERGRVDAKSNGMSAHMARIVARYRRVAL